MAAGSWLKSASISKTTSASVLARTHWKPAM